MMNGPLGAICMLRDAKALGYKPTWTGVGFSWNINLVASATGGAAEGIVTLAAGTTLDTPAGKHFLDLMEEKAPNHNKELSDALLFYYALAQDFLEGLRRNGPTLTREGFVTTFETKMTWHAAF